MGKIPGLKEAVQHWYQESIKDSSEGSEKITPQEQGQLVATIKKYGVPENPSDYFPIDGNSRRDEYHFLSQEATVEIPHPALIGRAFELADDASPTLSLTKKTIDGLKFTHKHTRVPRGLRSAGMFTSKGNGNIKVYLDYVEVWESRKSIKVNVAVGIYKDGKYHRTDQATCDALLKHVKQFFQEQYRRDTQSSRNLPDAYVFKATQRHIVNNQPTDIRSISYLYQNSFPYWNRVVQFWSGDPKSGIVSQEQHAQNYYPIAVSEAAKNPNVSSYADKAKALGKILGKSPADVAQDIKEIESGKQALEAEQTVQRLLKTLSFSSSVDAVASKLKEVEALKGKYPEALAAIVIPNMREACAGAYQYQISSFNSYAQFDKLKDFYELGVAGGVDKNKAAAALVESALVALEKSSHGNTQFVATRIKQFNEFLTYVGSRDKLLKESNIKSLFGKVGDKLVGKIKEYESASHYEDLMNQWRSILHDFDSKKLDAYDNSNSR